MNIENMYPSGPMYFVFCRLYHSQPRHQGSVWGPTCHITTSNYITLYRRCGLAYPYDGRGFVGPKKKTIVGLLQYSILSVCIPLLYTVNFATCVGNIRAKNQVGIGMSYRPASLCSLATQFQTRFLELIPRPTYVFGSSPHTFISPFCRAVENLIANYSLRTYYQYSIPASLICKLLYIYMQLHSTFIALVYRVHTLTLSNGPRQCSFYTRGGLQSTCRYFFYQSR